MPQNSEPSESFWKSGYDFSLSRSPSSSELFSKKELTIFPKTLNYSPLKVKKERAARRLSMCYDLTSVVTHEGQMLA